MVGGKAVPKTEEEVRWFVGHIQEELKDVKSMTQLAELWNFNAVAVKSLPEALKGEVIAAKDEAKARLR